MTVSLAALPKGHAFAETRFELTREWVAAYVDAVEDETISLLVEQACPPLSLAALSIRALLDQAGLPDGAIHVSQELSLSHAAWVGDALVARARIASRGERAGWVLMGVELEVENKAGTVLITGRASITFPAISEVTQ